MSEKFDKAGTALHEMILGGLPKDWELDDRESAVLDLACRQADVVAALEAAAEESGVMVKGSTGQMVVNPAVVEARQGRLAVDRLIGKIVLPEPEKAEGHTSATEMGRRAARARWSADGKRRSRRGAA